MKSWILGVALLGACSDTQNLGDHFTFHSPRWGVSIEPLAGPETPAADALFVAVDGGGDVIAAGQYYNSIDFGTTTLVNPGPQPAPPGFWVTKRSGIDGSEKWTLGMADGNFAIDALAVDAQNDVIIAGGMGDAHDFGGQTLHGYYDAYVAKYAPDGSLVWASGLGPMSGAYAHSVAVSPTGQIYVSAFVNTYLRTPQGPTLQRGEVVATYDADGTLLWVNALPFGAHVAVTSDGGVVVGGILEQTTTFGGTKIDLTQDGDCVVAKLDAAGSVQWVHSFGEPGARHGTSRFSVDSADRVAAVMSEQDKMPTEALIDASGVIWSAQAPSGAATANAVMTYEDLVLTTGTSGAPVDFGNGKMIGSMYFAARDTHGALVDAQVYGDPTLGRAGVSALATGPNGELAFAGATTEPVDFGGGPLAGPTQVDGQNLILGIIDAP
jgi:hypothetical protein